MKNNQPATVKLMKSILMLLVCFAFSAKAHNPKISTFTFRDTGGGWIIEMAFAKASIDVAMLEEYSQEELQSFSREEYRDNVVTYVKNHFNLIVDNQKVKLLDGGIMLGDHQTNLKFVLPQIPSSIEEIKVDIPMFENIYNHTNIFRIYRGGGEMDKFFLSSDNDFKAQLQLTSQGVTQIEYVDTNWKLVIAILALSIICLTTVYWVWSGRRSLQMQIS